MRSGVVEVRAIVAQHLMQVTLAQDEHMIQALTPDTPQEALHNLYCAVSHPVLSPSGTLSNM